MSMVCRILFIIPLLITMLACNNDADQKPETLEVSIADDSIDDVLADSLSVFFQDEYFVEDLQFLVKDSTQYQFYKIDLNNDGQKEIFIRFFGNYFCGSGGCKFIILSQSLAVLNTFTTTQAPIIASQEFQNDWRVLFTKVGKEQKMLINKNGKYPSNPSMAPLTNIPISRDDVKMFDDIENPSKNYFF